MEIFKNLTSNTTIITPNRRLSATLSKNYQAYQLENKKVYWATLDILPYQRWIERLWNETAITYMTQQSLIITNQQEQLLWEKIIKDNPINETLLQLSATAELAKSAWATLKQWQVDLHHPMLALSEDSSAFQQWALAFQTICEENAWIDFNSASSHIIHSIESGLVSLPEKIIVAGFTELTPLQKKQFETCKKILIEIDYIDTLPFDKDAKSFYISFPDIETEILTIAKWAKNLIHSNPSLKIACIIPDLENQRDRIRQVFSEVITDEAFNISAGKNLINYPIIYAALKILKLNNKYFSLEDMNYLLLTPFIGDAEKEFTQRALFESKLRKENILTIAFSDLEKLNIHNYCYAFSKRIKKLIEKWETLSEEKYPSDWVQPIIELLSILGWPGERSMNSQEYQVVQRFLEVLHEYQSFDAITKKINYSECIKHIESLIKNTVFQPQSNEAPIQILGLLEAANLPFDYSWIAGLDDSVWPPPAKPNPFIPYKLQKTLQMPHSTADKELHYSTKLIEQLKKSTRQIIFSHALTINDCELRPSALIVDNPKITVDNLTLSDFLSKTQKLYQSRWIETLIDDNAPSLETAEKITGGVSILKNQAACPFKAFAEIRLKAKKLELPSLGLRPQDRGILTHKALEFLWDNIKEHGNLIRLNDDELVSIIDQSIDHAIEQIKKPFLSSQYLALETIRLKKLLWNWLILESKRPSFKVIAKEKECAIQLNAITLNVRVDRIDELENGDYLVIDYKTSKNNSITSWFGNKPDEPQLPLYCLTDKNTPHAIAYAEILPGQCSLKGISQHDLLIDKIQSISHTKYTEIKQWNQQILEWKSILENIAAEFEKGYAAVMPKKPIETCQYCDLKPLCRIHEER